MGEDDLDLHSIHLVDQTWREMEEREDLLAMLGGGYFDDQWLVVPRYQTAIHKACALVAEQCRINRRQRAAEELEPVEETHEKPERKHTLTAWEKVRLGGAVFFLLFMLFMTIFVSVPIMVHWYHIVVDFWW